MAPVFYDQFWYFDICIFASIHEYNQQEKNPLVNNSAMSLPTDALFQMQFYPQIFTSKHTQE